MESIKKEKRTRTGEEEEAFCTSFLSCISILQHGLKEKGKKKSEEKKKREKMGGGRGGGEKLQRTTIYFSSAAYPFIHSAVPRGQRGEATRKKRRKGKGGGKPTRPPRRCQFTSIISNFIRSRNKKRNGEGEGAHQAPKAPLVTRQHHRP